jgi:hypothetical protein
LPVPRYYFALRWPDQTYEDETGTLLSNDDDAHAKACRIIRELKEGGYNDQDIEMVIKNEDGEVIHIIQF